MLAQQLTKSTVYQIININYNIILIFKYKKIYMQ